MKQLRESVEREPLHPGNTFEEWFRNWLKENSEDYENGPSGLAADIAEHGVGGGYSGLVYYSETTALYAEHKDGIWEIIQEVADDQGTDVLTLLSRSKTTIEDADSFENTMVWMAVELLAVVIQDEAEEDYSDLDGDIPEGEEAVEGEDEDL